MKSEEKKQEFSNEDKKSFLRYTICLMIIKLWFVTGILILGFIFNVKWIIVLYQMTVPFYTLFNALYFYSESYWVEVSRSKSYGVLCMCSFFSFLILSIIYSYSPSIAMLATRAYMIFLTLVNYFYIVAAGYLTIKSVED